MLALLVRRGQHKGKQIMTPEQIAEWNEDENETDEEFMSRVREENRNRESEVKMQMEISRQKEEVSESNKVEITGEIIDSPIF